MNVKIAREKIEEAIKAGAERLSAAGLKTKVRSFYTDKNLAETEEFSPKVILLFGDVAFGYESMDFDDYCNYSICCEVKSAEVNEKELEDGIAEFNKEIDKVIEKVSSATSPESVIEEILSIKPNLTERELRLVLANFAVQLFYQSRDKELESNIILYDYIKKSINGKEA